METAVRRGWRKPKAGHWFLPETPDVVALLRAQAEITVRGLRAFAAWAAGQASRAEEVRRAEHECDQARHGLVDALRGAFTTPLEPEDLFQLSRDLDKVINGAKDTVRESEAMGFPPDAALAEMAELLVEGVEHLCRAFGSLDGRGARSPDPATEAADAAVKSQRKLERVYRQATGNLVQSPDLRVAIASRELYRRVATISDDIVDVADRIWYSQVKET